MKIALYSPYLDTAGGGEKYILTIAEILSGSETVDVLLNSHLLSIGKESIIAKNEKFHGLDLSKVNFIDSPFNSCIDILSKINFLSKYDWLFYLSDGSIFFSSAKNSIIHFQMPFDHKIKGLWNSLKLKSWKKGICNSIFTKQIIQKYWNLPLEVIYPPVSVTQFKVGEKNKKIISVGRFFGFTKSKKHKVIIDSFKLLVDKFRLHDWSLHLAGGVDEGSIGYLNQLKRHAEGYQVKFYPNLSIKELVTLYAESSIYWHAAGFGEIDPKMQEHFGITTVEAMAAGCVPVVVNLGGQTEIVQDGVNGYLWDSPNELIGQTKELIDNKPLLERLSQAAVVRSMLFSKEKFESRIKELIYG